ncbi:MAG: Uma2 family endonuclease [Myxococcales bacterium]|nr:Uma2 family endonuclease [Myxococcales bacterium]
MRRCEYEQIVAAGVLGDDRVELLYGTIVAMSPHGPEHDDRLGELAERLIAALGSRAKVRVQSAFAASDGSEPEPDLAVVPRRSYRDAHPSDAWLIVEVADASLRKDRGPKARLYAESGVEEYWVVNLVDRAIELHAEPRDGTYALVTVHRPGETIALRRFPDVAMAVGDVVGPA